MNKTIETKITEQNLIKGGAVLVDTAKKGIKMYEILDVYYIVKDKKVIQSFNAIYKKRYSPPTRVPNWDEK